VLKEHVAAEPQAWLTPCQCSPYYNPSCYLLEIHELLRSNEGEMQKSPVEEEAHGRNHYSDLLPM
jgi:hypothetical protein